MYSEIHSIQGGDAVFGFKRLDEEFEIIRSAEFTPAERLAKLFGVTERTIRSDISKINGYLDGNGAHIAIKREAGYHLVVSSEADYQAFTDRFALAADQGAPDLTSADERIRFLLNAMLMSTDYLSAGELLDMVYVGENTLQNYMRQIREVVADYGLAVVTKPGAGFRLVGREEDRRRCFIDKVIIRNMRGYVTGFSKKERQLFAGIDLDLLDRIVRRDLSRSEIVTTDYGFKNLLVHIALMISRIKANRQIETAGAVDITARISCFIDDICADLERAFDITISEPERRYLFVHILSNTTLDEPDINERLIRNDIDEMLDLVYRNYGFDLRDDSELKNNLREHLLTTFRNKDLRLNIKNPLLNTIRSNFPLAFEIALASTLKVFDTEPHTLTEDEVGYVALHIGAAIERKSPKGQPRLCVILICGSGKSVAEMLKSRIDTFFGDKLEIVGPISYRKFTSLETTMLADIDFVVTTVPLDDCVLPHVLVDFSLNTQDTESISRLVNTIGGNRASKIGKFFHPALFERVGGSMSKGAVLELLCSKLEAIGVVEGDFIASVIEREGLSDTNMGPNFAIPHSMKPISLNTKVAVALLDEPVGWNEDAPEVRIVFLLAVRAGDRENIENLYDLLLEIVNNRHMQQAVLDARDFETFMAALGTEEA